MNLDQDIRTMLRARAEEVAAAPMIPPSTLRRVRVRKTLMTGGVAAVAAALVLGGFAASRSLSNDAPPVPPADQIEKTDPTLPPGFPKLTTTFVSARNGFSMKHPDRAAVTPAKQLWGFNKDVDDGFDVVETGLAAVFKGASTNNGFGGDGTTDERVDEYLADDTVLPDGCGVPRSEHAKITIDGLSGRISECENRIEATVIAGGRLYLFTLEHTRSDARALFDAFAATIDLTPETAVDFPAMATSFVSPTYGYSFKYHDRGGLAPAKSIWDPRHQPRDSFDFDDRFDAVETGLGAYFAAASTETPAGVSIDEWVDDHVSPDGCGVPRGEQEELTVDGQPGRITECPSRIEATVVSGGRLYLFALLHTRSDARAFFDAWVATIDLTPETAAVP
jgi:hypothetical protein